MKIRLFISISLILLALVVGLLGRHTARVSQAETAHTKGNLIRLHIIANSNSPTDQDVKLVVRDAILQAADQVFSGAVTKEEARVLIAEHWELIQTTAAQVVQEQGFDHRVQLQLGSFAFPDRTYADLVLPAGHYDALRIVIGEGQGHNWWCVMFPPLCLVSLQEDLEQEHLVAVNGDVEEGEIEFRFRIWEQLGQTTYGQTIQEWTKASLLFLARSK